MLAPIWGVRSGRGSLRHFLRDDEQAAADRDRKCARERCGCGCAERRLERQEQGRQTHQKADRKEKPADNESGRRETEPGGRGFENPTFFPERF